MRHCVFCFIDSFGPADPPSSQDACCLFKRPLRWKVKYLTFVFSYLFFLLVKRRILGANLIAVQSMGELCLCVYVSHPVEKPII